MKKVFGCVNNTIRLHSGLYLDLADPKPDQFLLDDIIVGLSNICRFGGQLPRFYSVAEHSLNCLRAAVDRGYSADEQAAVLLHDAAEAFIGDCVKPLKIMLPDYAAVEARVEKCIGEKFRIDFATHAAAVSQVDNAVLIAERRLFIPDRIKWHGEDSVDTAGISIATYERLLARTLFAREAARFGIE